MSITCIVITSYSIHYTKLYEVPADMSKATFLSSLKRRPNARPNNKVAVTEIAVMLKPDLLVSITWFKSMLKPSITIAAFKMNDE